MKKKLLNLFTFYKSFSELNRNISLIKILGDKYKEVLSKLDNKLSTLTNTVDEKLDLYLVKFDPSSQTFFSNYEINKNEKKEKWTWRKK